ncbi:hypothetical protein QPK87_20080 [Kamptonema cortianum]|nr:hypothetical protein [Geitlerinema splendidum]MDK3158858.1 hypothetical protein [Kamptonema cortianum]
MRKIFALAMLLVGSAALFGCQSGPADDAAPEGDAPQQVEAPAGMLPPEERGQTNDGG